MSVAHNNVPIVRSDHNCLPATLLTHNGMSVARLTHKSVSMICSTRNLSLPFVSFATDRQACPQR
jgi:hypothetical protein